MADQELPESGLAGFEAAMQALEQIVTRMEREELPLEQALSAFEQGMALVRQCQRSLDLAEQRVQVLLGNGSEAVLVNGDGIVTSRPQETGFKPPRAATSAAPRADVGQSASPPADPDDDVPF